MVSRYRYEALLLMELSYVAHNVRTPLGGTITLDIHVVASGETRIHEGLSDLAAQRLSCCSQAPLMASLIPSSSTEVASLGKIATFIFRYRTISASSPVSPTHSSRSNIIHSADFLRAYGLAPVERQPFTLAFRTPHVGDKRSVSSLDSDPDDEDDASSPNSVIPLYVATPRVCYFQHYLGYF